MVGEAKVCGRRTLTREQLGIADSERDVYETPDEEAPGCSLEQQELDRELEACRKSEKEDRPTAPVPIDRAPLEPSAARSLFQARDLVCLPPESDFSQQRHEQRRTEWRILGSRHRALETPFDRYTRLLAEAQALERDLQTVEQECAADGTSTEHLYPSHIRHEVETLVSRVEGMQPRVLKHPLVPDNGSSCNGSPLAHLLSLSRRLQDKQHGDGRKMKSDSTQGAPAGGEEPDFGVGCEDMEEVAACGTASVRMGDRSMHTDLTSVERRLAELESVVGDGEVAGLYPDLCTALDTMETRLSLLDPATLQAVGAEVSNLEERLSKVESQEANAADSTEMGGGGLFAHGRLQRLSDAVDRWDSVSHVLPSLLARLRTLRSVHEEASGVVLDVQQLKQVHASTGMALRAQEAALLKAAQSLCDNVSTMAANIASLDARLQSLESA